MTLIGRQLALLLLLGMVLAGCTSFRPPGTSDTRPSPAIPSATTMSSVPAVPTLAVPTGLIGTSMSAAKSALTKAGFTHIVVAGGHGITEGTKVTEVTHAGETVPPDTKIVLTGAAAPTPAKTLVPTNNGTHRTAPTIGADCRPGDEKDYRVCAGHKAWVDGQLEYANCLDSGGSWDIPDQSCTRPRAH